jgi:hypothetical protein
MNAELSIREKKPIFLQMFKDASSKGPLKTKDLKKMNSSMSKLDRHNASLFRSSDSLMSTKLNTQQASKHTRSRFSMDRSSIKNFQRLTPADIERATDYGDF